jgi:hypothetical protein
MFLAGGFSRIGLDATSDKKAGYRCYSDGVAIHLHVWRFWLTVPWLYPAEIFPLIVRAKGNAWGVVGWSLGNGQVYFLYHSELSKSNRLRSLTLDLPYVFGAVNVISIPIGNFDPCSI